MKMATFPRWALIGLVGCAPAAGPQRASSESTAAAPTPAQPASTHAPIARDAALAQLDGHTTQERVARLVAWLHDRMPWVSTDYRERTVDQILERGAGNCADHARVLQSLLESKGIRTRWVSEINIQPPDPGRQERAERLVKARGLGASVFGRQHNDHRWLEVWSAEAGEWFPADSAIGVVGVDGWTRARVGFRPRPAAIEEMIVPFVVVARSPGEPAEDRTRAYLVAGFDQAYGGRLRALPTWQAWTEEVVALSAHGQAAMRGEANLHEHDGEMTKLLETYRRLKADAAAAAID